MSPISRRKLLAGAAGALPLAASGVAKALTYEPGVVAETLLSAIIPRPAYGSAFFPGQSAIGSNVDKNGNPQVTQLANMGGNSIIGYSTTGSTSASLLSYLLSDSVPSTIMRLFTASNNNNFEHFEVTILPPGTGCTLYNATQGNYQRTAFNVPALRLKAAAFVGGALAINTWIAQIPRWWPGTWQMYEIFLNSITAGNAAQPFIWHFLKGQQTVEPLVCNVGWPNYDTPAGTVTPVNPPQLFIPWGMSGTNSVLNLTVGGLPGPTVNGVNGAMGQSLQNVTLDSVAFAPIKGNPLATTNALVRNNNSFVQPPFGFDNIFINNAGRSPVHLMGPVYPGLDVGFSGNLGGVLEDVNGDILFMDTAFRGLPGNNPIEQEPVSVQPFSDQ